MYVNSNQELQRKITRVCHRNGLTRKDVLKAVNIKSSKRDLTVDELTKVTNYLEVTIKELFV